MAERKIGTITHYFSNISVGVIKLDDTLKVGDKVKIAGTTTNFEQTISEMQINKQNVQEAGSGQEVGVKVSDKVRTGDEVFVVE